MVPVVVVVMWPDPVPVPVAPLSELDMRPALDPLELQVLPVPPPTALGPAAPCVTPSEASPPCTISTQYPHGPAMHENAWHQQSKQPGHISLIGMVHAESEEAAVRCSGRRDNDKLGRRHEHV